MSWEEEAVCGYDGLWGELRVSGVLCAWGRRGREGERGSKGEEGEREGLRRRERNAVRAHGCVFLAPLGFA